MSPPLQPYYLVNKMSAISIIAKIIYIKETVTIVYTCQSIKTVLVDRRASLLSRFLPNFSLLVLKDDDYIQNTAVKYETLPDLRISFKEHFVRIERGTRLDRSSRKL